MDIAQPSVHVGVVFNREEFKWRVREAATRKRWNQRQFAEQLKMTESQLTDILNRQTPSIPTIERLAEKLEVAPGWLAFGEGDATGVVGEKEDAMPRKLTVEDVVAPKKSNYQRVEIPQMHKLPVVNKIAADEKPTFAKAEGTEMVDVRYSRQNHYCLRVIGQSMKPTANEGDICVVEHVHHVLDALDVVGPADKKFWKTLHKKLVCASVNDADPVLKRMMVYDRPPRAKSNFKIILVGDNRSAESIEVTSEDRLVVVGIVRKIMKDPDNFE